jgi:hypothetical protein
MYSCEYHEGIDFGKEAVKKTISKPIALEVIKFPPIRKILDGGG